MHTITPAPANNPPSYDVSSISNQYVNIGESLVFYIPNFTDADIGDEHIETAFEIDSALN